MTDFFWMGFEKAAGFGEALAEGAKHVMKDPTVKRMTTTALAHPAATGAALGAAGGAVAGGPGNRIGGAATGAAAGAGLGVGLKNQATLGALAKKNRIKI